MSAIILLDTRQEIRMDSYLQKLHNAITSASSGMSSEDLTRHPQGKWSAAEVLEHLYLTYTGTTKGCERCLQEGRTLARTPTLRDRVRTTVVTGLGFMPEGRKSPARAMPRGMPPEEVLNAIETMLASMDEAIARCEARFGKRAKLMDHPVLGPLTARQWRKFHWVHGHHHVKQIRRLRETA
jgi:hypothetical protein